jgi:predicted TIM-barrel fold metal-dependent hydrolase
MDIVDCQAHLGPGGIEQIRAAMDAVGIKAALIDEFWLGSTVEMPAYSVRAAGQVVRRTVTPTAELAALTHPDRFSYIVRPDRRDPELHSLIRLARDAPHARALRITPGLARTELSAVTSGGYDDMFKAAADCGLPVFVTIPGNAPALRSSIEKFAALTFIIDHCGMPFTAGMKKGLLDAGLGAELPEMGGGTNEAEFDKVLRLAELPNVALKWGHAQGLFGVSGYPFPNLRPYLRSALNEFGAERMMWAGDASVNLTGESWAELLFWLVDNPELSQSEREKLLGGTARRILNWSA